MGTENDSGVGFGQGQLFVETSNVQGLGASPSSKHSHESIMYRLEKLVVDWRTSISAWFVLFAMPKWLAGILAQSDVQEEHGSCRSENNFQMRLSAFVRLHKTLLAHQPSEAVGHRWGWRTEI